jgi:tRNA-dihydrouridine synthase
MSTTTAREPFFILAPMDDVTDVVFRSVIADCYAPDMFFTEFVNVDGLMSIGRPKLIHKLAIRRETDHKIIAQIWGKNPANYRAMAHELVEMGFDGVDINMGCPQKNEVKNGCCSALINDRELASAIITATQEGVAGRVPVSVKTRLGWNEIDFTWHEHLLVHDLDMLSVHLRTRKEMSDVPAHWDKAPELVKLRDELGKKTLLVGNGDVQNRAHGTQLAEESGLDGIMIGRGVFKDPFCFDPQSPWATESADEKIQLYITHVERFTQTWQNRERNFQSLKRFCKVYIGGFDGASELRERVMSTNAGDELIAVLQDARALYA